MGGRQLRQSTVAQGVGTPIGNPLMFASPKNNQGNIIQSILQKQNATIGKSNQKNFVEYLKQLTAQTQGPMMPNPKYHMRNHSNALAVSSTLKLPSQNVADKTGIQAANQPYNQSKAQRIVFGRNHGKSHHTTNASPANRFN